MSKNTLYGRVSRIENYFSMLLTKYKVSKNIFVSQLPVNINPEWQDMVLIDVGKGMYKNAFNSVSVNIFLYGRPQGDAQIKNVKIIDKMEAALIEAVNNNIDEHYHPHIQWSDSDYDSVRNFHYNVININLIVNN